MPAILLGQQFPNLQLFKQALRVWAIERNFTPSILDSDSHRVRAGCRSSPDCPFRIRANFLEKRGYAKVTTCDDVHNCTSTSDHLVSQNIPRAETCKLKFLIGAVPNLLAVTKETTTGNIIEAVERKYGQKIALRQAQKVKQLLVPKTVGPCRECHQPGHSRRYCPSRQPPASDSTMACHDDLFEDSPTGMDIDSSEEERPRQPMHCLLCFQPGHNRRNCPTRNTAAGLNNVIPSNLGNSTFSNPPADRPTTVTAQNVDPSLLSGNLTTAASGQQIQQAQVIAQPSISGAHTTMISGQASNVHAGQQNKPPQDARMEAAKLMGQAARLMHEAARLNSEAARLTASAAILLERLAR